MPARPFFEHVFVDEAGHEHHYLLADRRVRIAYDSHKRYFACRQVTRLDEESGHQTQIVTTRDDPDPSLVAHAMFSRWRQENFFKYGRARFGIDALDSYETTPDDLGRLVANPARRDAKREVIRARAELARAEQTEGRANLDGMQTDTTVRAAFEEARAEVVRLEERARALPAKVPFGEVRPQAARAEVERKRIHDAARMATYNAESALARMLTPHYARAEDEARSLLRETYRASGDLEVVGNELHVRIAPLSAAAAIPCVGGTLSGADGDRDALPRDRSAPRLLGEYAVSLQRFWPHVRSCGFCAHLISPCPVMTTRRSMPQRRTWFLSAFAR